MTTATKNELLSSLKQELNDVRILKGLELDDGMLKISLDDGTVKNIPKIAEYLNNDVLRQMITTAEVLKKKGFVSNIISFFQLLAILVVLAIVSTSILIFLGVKALFGGLKKKKDDVPTIQQVEIVKPSKSKIDNGVAITEDKKKKDTKLYSQRKRNEIDNRKK